MGAASQLSSVLWNKTWPWIIFRRARCHFAYKLKIDNYNLCQEFWEGLNVMFETRVAREPRSEIFRRRRSGRHRHRRLPHQRPVQESRQNDLLNFSRAKIFEFCREKFLAMTFAENASVVFVDRRNLFGPVGTSFRNFSQQFRKSSKSSCSSFGNVLLSEAPTPSVVGL